jgi:Polysaccharide pyruvyl transferase
MTIYLYGAYGTGNLGDDLLLKGALLEHANEDIRVVSYGKPFINGVDDYINYYSFLDKPSEYLKRGDRFIFSGGGLFWSNLHCDEMLKISKEARKLDAHVSIKKIGAQGLDSNPEAIKRIMSLCDIVTVRDQNSIDILKEYGITERATYSHDYVLTLGDYISQNHPKCLSNKISVGINHSPTLFYYDDEHRKKTLRIYAHIAKKYKDQVDFVYIPHTRHFSCIEQNDILYGEHFWLASSGLIKPLPFPTSIDGLLSYYARLDGVIGWRYHLLVLGTLFKAQVVYLGSIEGHKYSAFAKENNIPQIDFGLSENEIIRSTSRWIEKLILEK